MAVIAFPVAKYLLSYYLTTLLRSAEVSKCEFGKQVANSSSTTSGWRGVTLQRHLNEGAAG